MKKPPLIPSLITLAFVVLMTNLGFWQLNRAQEKEQLLVLLADDKITEINNKTQLKDLLQYANIVIQGQFLSAPQLLLDNQIDEGVVGYHVFTPFVIEGLDTTIMVNRGWIAKEEFKPEQLTVNSDTIKISGKLNHPPQVGIQLGEIQLDRQKPHQVMTYYDKQKVSGFLHEKLCTGLNCTVSRNIMWLQADQVQGFKRDWRPIIMPPSKHFGYAVQWFSMTLVLVLWFIYWLRKL
ncbi:MAG: SURF1 family protein [Proteobacteria bacterium]|nr:SURF1 family protein [Pseudomonadota bacterium]